MQERAVIRATVFTTFLIIHLKTGIIFLQTKYIPNMSDLLFLGQENPYILFTVTDESLLDVAIKFSVPPTVIIYDNTTDMQSVAFIQHGKIEAVYNTIPWVENLLSKL